MNEQGDSEHELRCGEVERLPMRNYKEQKTGPEGVLLTRGSLRFPLRNALALGHNRQR